MNTDVHPTARLMTGAFIGQNVRIGPNVLVGPNASILGGVDDVLPTVVEAGVQIGANSVILPGIRLAGNCVVRPGSVVTRSVPPGAIVEGNPAIITGYINTPIRSTSIGSARKPEPGSTEVLSVNGVTLHHFPIIPDLRGNLTVGDFNRQIPFIPMRYFMIFGVPNREVRGEHAHKECHQFMVCVRGTCAVVADDGFLRCEVELDEPSIGVHLPPMTWGIQYKYSPDALLLVFASHYYDPKDYIRDYDQFLDETRRKIKS